MENIEELELEYEEKVRESEPILIPDKDSIPSSVGRTQKINDVRWVSGEGQRPARVLFIATSVLEEEEVAYYELSNGKRFYDRPQCLKGTSGQVLRNLTKAAGIDVDKNYYTTWIKWLAPKAMRTKPNAEMMAAGREALMSDIRETDPDIIVTFGKPVFSELTGSKLSLKDAVGGWFGSKLEGRFRRIYVTECVTRMATKPEQLERFRKDFMEVSRMLATIDGVYTPEYEERYQTIDTSEKLRELVSKLKEEEQTVLSVDCEWHGPNHLQGQLRSLQLCWAPGEAAYIRFMDDQLNYALDVDYKEAGSILSEWLDDPQVKYIGHHIGADLPWMSHVLGLEWFGKAIFDTEFAQQCVDEGAELGLERMGMAYTDMGRYDLALTKWKKNKKNTGKTKDGYGLIPDRIIMPYGCKDVDTVMRAWPHIRKKMEQDYGGRLTGYYDNIFNPFVTNFFSSFTLKGLPVSKSKIDHLRNLYHYCRDLLDKQFKSLVVIDAEEQLRQKFIELEVSDVDDLMDDIMQLSVEDEHEQACLHAFESIAPEQHLDFKPYWDYYAISPIFNPNSTDHMRLMLFEVKKYEPIKTTDQKEKGLPSVPWAKVLELPEDKRRAYRPSTDSQTLSILQSQHSDPLLTKLLEFKSVNTVCKSFLGDPVKDPETGEVLEEKGLHSFIVPNRHGGICEEVFKPQQGSKNE